MSSDSEEMRSFCFACQELRADIGEEIPRGACPKCGNTMTVSYPPGEEFVLTAGGFSIASKPPSGGRWFHKSLVQHSHCKKTDQRHFIQRTIDRDRNRYQERIVNIATGEVVREVNEPLTEHQGRGSAKKGIGGKKNDSDI
jgi:hypothetical protein